MNRTSRYAVLVLLLLCSAMLGALLAPPGIAAGGTAGAQRVLASGTATVESNTVAQIGTILSVSNESVQVYCFPTDNTSGIEWATTGTTVTSDAVVVFIKRTTTTNQGQVFAKVTVTNASRSFRWIVMGYRP